ncbi:DctP family TRAP transporter solute-binding subunit [Fictibacillus phosphorivorans]|uniref:DctP family TRAP transporter solute-binding subunit n=1 Tax=Fictibacillus phosphorivorans TaxID=1221500 RepID=UPI0020409F85|nr:DctP family TRAP transporter solute-binding subunit [Fictibacillus phosphorivorans]MCM3718989.1 DctP family TRAP transporter solute-binding subunit [Fictibacillus phosphorivorans]MCM3776611.1 DctP family TRAP transporter solute-binding subunit [Fictibacillus phosphorivorans]
MKAFLSVALLLCVGLAVSVWIGFHSRFSEGTLPFDDDQKGIKDQVVIKFSHVVAENTPKGLAAQRFAKLVNEKSEGKIKVEVVPNGGLYSDQEELEALKRGDIQMIAPATTKLSTFSPKFQVLDLPYAMPTRESMIEVLNGDIGKTLLQSLTNSNMKGLTFWTNGFKQITTNDGPLKSPSDLKGQTFRIMPSPLLEKQFQLLNAKAVGLDFNETYRLLESGELNGEENTISNIYSKKFFDVQSHLTVSDHGFLGYAVIMNEDFWNGLSKSQQQILKESLQETTTWNQTYSFEMNDEQLRLIEKQSEIEIYHLTKEEKRKWADFFEPVYKAFDEEIGTELIEQIKKVRANHSEL